MVGDITKISEMGLFLEKNVGLTCLDSTSMAQKPVVLSLPSKLQSHPLVSRYHYNNFHTKNKSVLQKVVVSKDCFSYQFLCNKWLAVDEDDGKIERVLLVAGDKELATANNVFIDKSTSGFTDAHMWFSVAVRPQHSNFTRLQRLTCCLSWLAMTMVASILWFVLI